MFEAEKRAREKWGIGWKNLSENQQMAYINQEKYFLIKAELRSAKGHGQQSISIDDLILAVEQC